MESKRRTRYVLTLVVLTLFFLVIRKIVEPVKIFDEELLIDDSLLDDSQVFDEDYDYEFEVQNYYIKKQDQGQYAKEQECYNKVFFHYETRAKDAVKLILKPNKNSDYIITIPNKEGLHIEVWRQKLLQLNSLEPVVETNSTGGEVNHYLYSLKKGVTYYIYIFNDNTNEIASSIDIEQDNWIYAPYGGFAQYRFQRVNFFSNDFVFNVLESYAIFLFDDDLKELTIDLYNESKKEHWARMFSMSLWDYLDVEECAADFCKICHNFENNNQYIQACSDSNFNIKIITSLSGIFYTLKCEKWNKENYIPKYFKGIRLGDYQLFTDPCNETELTYNWDWVYYIR